ncbi:hypothetical protein LCM00_06320 [Bacillus infantis]|uniref:hypothetical protein n=1 Tax=Bacillus infantis TaxID=324767 RepID=UPI001CD4E342|nr:hypothetical protein [Bacillus infantis]MCA1039120.1 hypothetical protein [Bacillus infantis]
MGYVMIGLIAAAILLLILSFFLKDPYKSIREEIDQVSIHQIQELYLIKKKLKVLEEELLVDGAAAKPAGQPISSGQVNPILKNQVLSLSQQGLSIDQISKQSSLSRSSVQEIVNEFSARREYS